MADCNRRYPVISLNANKIAIFFLCTNHVLIEDITVFLVFSLDFQDLSILGVFVDVMLQNNSDAIDLIWAVADEKAGCPHKDFFAL